MITPPQGFRLMQDDEPVMPGDYAFFPERNDWAEYLGELCGESVSFVRNSRQGYPPISAFARPVPKPFPTSDQSSDGFIILRQEGGFTELFPLIPPSPRLMWMKSKDYAESMAQHYANSSGGTWVVFQAVSRFDPSAKTHKAALDHFSKPTEQAAKIPPLHDNLLYRPQS